MNTTEQYRSDVLKAMWVSFAAAILIVLAAGCAAMGGAKKKTESSTDTAGSIAASNAITVSRVVHGQQAPAPVTVTPPAVTMSGSSNVLTIQYQQPAPTLPARARSGLATRDEIQPPLQEFSEELNVNQTGGQAATETSKENKKSSWSPALWLTIAGSGIGLILVAWGIKAVRSSSAAANAAFEAGDQMIAEAIRRVRAKATQSVDPARIAEHNAEIAELEAQRGRLQR